MAFGKILSNLGQARKKVPFGIFFGWCGSIFRVNLIEKRWRPGRSIKSHRNSQMVFRPKFGHPKLQPSLQCLRKQACVFATHDASDIDFVDPWRLKRQMPHISNNRLIKFTSDNAYPKYDGSFVSLDFMKSVLVHERMHYILQYKELIVLQ